MTLDGVLVKPRARGDGPAIASALVLRRCPVTQDGGAAGERNAEIGMRTRNR
jgi:hypothetical protein